MNKFVKSTDPRKKQVVLLLKGKTGANKITNVRQVGETSFTGNCFKSLGSRKYEALGTITVNFSNEEETNVQANS